MAAVRTLLAIPAERGIGQIGLKAAIRCVAALADPLNGRYADNADIISFDP